MTLNKILFCGIFLSSIILGAQTTEKITSHVNPFIGTGAAHGSPLSGNNYPGATVPFGMVQLSPDTRNTPDWSVRLVIDMIKNGLNFSFTDELIIKDYDSDPNILQEIELYIESTSQNVQVIVDGELHRIIATHTNIDLTAWDVSNVWGMITVEPTESSPRWTCSTVIPTDGNLLNPLSAITGNVATLTFPSPEVAQIECFFDPSKINLQNGVKFTTKIKGCYV